MYISIITIKLNDQLKSIKEILNIPTSYYCRNRAKKLRKYKFQAITIMVLHRKPKQDITKIADLTIFDF